MKVSKKVSKIVSGILCVVFLLSCIGSNVQLVHAQTSLSEYQKCMDEFNEKYGTDFNIPSEEDLVSAGKSYSDMVKFYQNIGIDGMEEYLLSLYENENNTAVINDIKLEMKSTRAFGKTQHYYYSSTYVENQSERKYLSITSTVYYADGTNRYASIDGFGWNAYSYPYYMPKHMTYEYSSGNEYVHCVFTCDRYIAEYVVNAMDFKVSVVFSANGGDVEDYV